MENSRIGKLMFLETLILGAAATAVGIAFGVFFSKIITMFLLKMTMSSFSGDISFSIGISAIIITIVLYFGIFCLMGLSGLRVINKSNLVDLFKGAKVSEGKSAGSYVLLVMSLILISYGYYLAFTLEAEEIVQMMLTILVIVVIGTYLFFWGGFQKILYILKLNKKIYYKNANLVATSLLAHRAKTMATTMATIAILVAIGTTAISFGYVLIQTAEEQTYEQNGFDLYFYTGDETLTNDVHAIFDKHDNTIVDEIRFERYMTRPEGINIPERRKYFFGKDRYLRAYSESQYNAMLTFQKI
ncbi:MAG: hypothetical protein LR001_08730 [Clostridiales bacterium]|nr:hypothetical protein [Clostridiales bacterium]